MAAKVLLPSYAGFAERARDEARMLAAISGLDAGLGPSTDKWVNNALERVKRDHTALPGHAYVVRFFEAFNGWVRGGKGEVLAPFTAPTLVILMESGSARSLTKSSGPLDLCRRSERGP